MTEGRQGSRSVGGSPFERTEGAQALNVVIPWLFEIAGGYYFSSPIPPLLRQSHPRRSM
jgi:hypothetical protein